MDHPNIVKVYEFAETNTFIYLKMELVKSGALGILFII
jgi:serine/threonine protein kinase